MSWQVGAYVLLALALAVGFAWYERGRPDARVVALVATLAAFAALGRIAFAAVPNVKPTTDIVLISGYALGGAPGFVVGSLAGLTSNFFFGQGPWTPWQMAGWGAAGLLGAGLALAWPGRARGGSVGRWPLAAACGVVGFGFTALQDVGDWVTYSDHSSGQLAVYLGKGLGFDAVHAVGCVLFALAFGPALGRSLGRFTARLEVSWRAPASVASVLVLSTLVIPTATPSSVARASSTGATVAYLRSAQNRDGGLGPAPGQASQSLDSGWAALGLAAAGMAPGEVVHGGHSLRDYLLASAGASTDPGSLERTILALRAAGLPVRDVQAKDLLARLQHDVRRDGSVSDQVNLTSFALLALRAAGATAPGLSIDWLARQADHDGGFGFGPAGGSSDVDDTGAVLEALAGVASPRAARDRRRAVAYLRARQATGGGFPAQPGEEPNAQSTAWAVQGLIAAGAASTSVDRGIAFLGSLTAPDGHIRYSRTNDQTPVWVTAEALLALERKPLPVEAVGVVAKQPRPTAAGHKVAHKKARRAKTARRGPAAGASQSSAPALTLSIDFGFLSALVLAPLGIG